jgi:hypothetical protein
MEGKKKEKDRTKGRVNKPKSAAKICVIG